MRGGTASAVPLFASGMLEWTVILRKAIAMPTRIAVLILLLAASAAAHIPFCDDYADGPRVVGSLVLPSGASEVSLSGDRAYVASGDGGFHIVDVSDPCLLYTSPSPRDPE